MNLPRASVARPIFTSMVTLIVILLGLSALQRLRIDLLPDIEMPTLTINTSYNGASPEVVERMVTQVIEEVVAQVPGVEEIESTSMEGNSRVRATFVWGTNIDAAAADVRAAVEASLGSLPEDSDRPTVRKFDVNSFPIMILGISSNLEPVELTTLIEDQVRQRLGRIPGVAQVSMWGEYRREIRIELDPQRLRALGLPLNQILSAIRDANLDLPAGFIEEGRHEVTLRAPAEFRSVEEVRDTVVAMRDNAPVTIGQVAEVLDTHQRVSRIVRVNGKLGLRVAIRKQADANTVEVANAVLAEIERINQEFPQVTLVQVINQGSFIERSIRNVATSVFYGGALAVLVLIFFLRSIRSTVVIALSIPISVIATFLLIHSAGSTLNLMTLGGLALGVGMMVDSSIVVLENIYRRRNEYGELPKEASVAGAVEVGPAILASTLTTLVIFLPVVFMAGVSGMLFSELAYVIAFSLICSLIVSLSLVPMLTSKLLRPKQEAADTGFGSSILALAERAFVATEDAYKDLLGVVLNQRILTIAVTIAMLVGSLMLVPQLGREFMPPSDEGEVRVSGEMEVGTRLDVVDRQLRIMERIVAENVPELDSYVGSAGANEWNPNAGTTGEIRLSLTPATDRQRSNEQVAADLRRLLAGQLPGMTLRVRAPQGQFLLERILGGDGGLAVEVRGHDLEIMRLLTERAIEAMSNIEGVTNIQTSQTDGKPQEMLQIDRAKAADMGVSVRDITQAIETTIAGRQAGEFRDGGESYRILVQFKDAQRLSLTDVLDITLRNSSGQDVALRNLVTTESGLSPTVIERKDQQRLFTITADVVDRDIGSVADEVEAALAGIPRPTGNEFVMAGNVKEQRKATFELMLSLALALALVYMVLACQYESLRDPIIVMCAVPLAAIGVVLMLFLTDTTLNVQSYIGCIMLGGIVVNNAILLVDQAGRLRKLDNMTTRDAVAEAGRRRLRPILMTSLTTILGLTPLALGIGEGADAQAPLARAVIGGLISSMLTTLVVVPAAYTFFHPDKPKESYDAKQRNA